MFDYTNMRMIANKLLTVLKYIFMKFVKELANLIICYI